MKRKKIALWWGIALSLGLASGGAYATFSEIRPYVGGVLTPGAKVALLRSAPAEPGLSYPSRMLVLNDCNQAMSSFDALLLSAEDRRPLLENCIRTADIILSDTPVFSYAWFIKALASEGLEDYPALNANLVASREANPNQEWLAYSRAVLSYRNRAHLDQAATAAMAADILVAASEQRGLSWIAGQYVASPDDRNSITAIFEDAPASLQQRFLRNVTAQSAN